MDLQELKSTLWDAANTLRGPAGDRTDWKGYILPLPFFKRISDCGAGETPGKVLPAAPEVGPPKARIEAQRPAVHPLGLTELSVLHA